MCFLKEYCQLYFGILERVGWFETLKGSNKANIMKNIEFNNRLNMKLRLMHKFLIKVSSLASLILFVSFPQIADGQEINSCRNLAVNWNNIGKQKKKLKN